MSETSGETLTITAGQLREMNACEDGVLAFEAAYPNGYVGKWTAAEQRAAYMDHTLQQYIGWMSAYGLVPLHSMAGYDLRHANLQDASLRHANLQVARFRSADLEGADLRGADLRAADLRCADLRYADLRGANLRHADLRGANLRGANIIGTVGVAR